VVFQEMKLDLGRICCGGLLPDLNTRYSWSKVIGCVFGVSLFNWATQCRPLPLSVAALDAAASGGFSASLLAVYKTKSTRCVKTHQCVKGG
jgi:hypothetical protein